MGDGPGTGRAHHRDKFVRRLRLSTDPGAIGAGRTVTVGIEQQRERDGTVFVLPPKPVQIIAAHGHLVVSHTRRYFQTLWLAIRVRSPGLKALIWAPLQKWKRLHIVHCGVDTDQFTPRLPRETGATLMYVGRLDLVKGLPVLLESLVAVKQCVPDVQLRVVGDGPQRDNLERLAEELGVDDCTDFVGYQSQTAVRQSLAQTDLLVMSSFAEGVPVSLTEAMAAGLPVVTTRIAGIAELVEEGRSGYLVPPGDVNSLTARIVELLNNPQRRAQFGRAGRAKVESEFNIHREAAWLCEILTSALQGHTVGLRPDPNVVESPMADETPELVSV